YKSGEILEGDFDKENGNLIKGKATSKSGEILEGDFDKDTRAFIKGKRTFPDGRVVDFPEPKLPLTISGNTLTLNMNDGTTKKYTIKTSDNTKLEIKEKKSGELCEVVINGFVSALIDIKPKLTPPVSVYMGYGEPWQFNIKTGSSDSIKEIIFSPRAISDANIIEELLNQNDWIAKSNDGFSYYNKFARNRLADNSYEYWMVPNGANDYRKLNKE
ncbi:hypothetical protein KBC97_00855, partial [Candidatus Gracilibacteria bacterium]|nr:hypothetical protein [Candidatus Gracilibacteria bacterium]